MANSVLPYFTQILTALYTLGEELEQDEYGTTYLCLDKTTGEAYACKSIDKSKLMFPRRYDDVWREIQIMHRVSRIPSVVALRDAYEDSDHVHLVTELCEGGGIFDRIIGNRSFCERDAVGMMKTIVEFVESCHSLGVMHRDLKPENFVLESGKEDSLLRVTHLGSAVFFHPGDTFTKIVGSHYCVAPEVLKKKYGPEVDVWSAGIILYIMLSGAPPFWADTKKDLSYEILHGTLDLESQQWTYISDNAKDLIRKMLEKDPKKRLSAHYVLCHPWMTDESNVPDEPLDSVRLRLKRFSEMIELKKMVN